MEDVIARMQDEKNGIPIRTVKSFLSKIPSVFSGSDIVQWLIKNLTIEDPVEALHLGTLPGCVNTTEVDIKKSSRMRNPHKTRKSVYGLQNDIRSHSPTHTPTPDTKPPTEDELHQQIKYWQIQLDRHRLKMSKVADSLLSYTEQYLEYDPFLVPPDPSNPWLSDDTTFWELEASKEPSQQRVKRWGFGMDEALKDPVGREQFLKFLESEFSSENLSKEPSQQRVKRWGFGMDEALKDPVGREQFLKFLESEFSSENLRFWLAVEDLKKRPMREVPSRVQEIWQEFLAPGAPSAINLDSKSYDKTTQNVKEPGRYTFEDAQEHIYKLMKSDSYPRFIRSSAYQELLQAKKKVLVLCDLFDLVISYNSLE
ncbi:Regulator of G-protein signaling 7 [Tupaia chinensis]|uniref:Regulator of G-protein signaling 7 n=1 Tax=Tupaia chinensis TaxID=246437 RepID=L9L7Q1_TUPCH|nr:Regulator of G-protein signaling 7 [Tupaia chinensis]